MIADEINGYLMCIAPTAVCDNCISDRIMLLVHRARTKHITNALATTREFRRTLGRCATCGRRKKLTYAHRT